MGAPLFTNVDGDDPGWRNIRDAKDGPLYSARSRCEYLWQFFERHADANFRREFRNHLQNRYWEMHLTVSLILNGYAVTCPKPGPDAGIVYRGRRIWFEAVSPGPGDQDTPNYVAPPSMESAVVSDTPNEKMVLRYLNSISEKYERQYADWLSKGHVTKADAFVIALNPRLMRLDNADTNPPRILQAAYPIGNQYVVVDRKAAKPIATGHHYRGSIEKTPKLGEAVTPIDTGVFQDGKHNGLSALLCSRTDPVNHRGEYDGDYQLAPNPKAETPLPQTFRLRGTYFAIENENTIKPQEIALPS